MKNSEQIMRKIQIDKVTLNCGCGTSGERVERSIKLLSTLSGMKPVKTVTNKRIPTWGVRPGLEIGAKVTLRGEKAIALLKRLLMAAENTLPSTKFDSFGNFSFGIHEYLLIPGVEYDPDVGIQGLNIAVTLERPGFRIKRRRYKPHEISKRHAIAKEEAMTFVHETFGTTIVMAEKKKRAAAGVAA